MNRDVTDFYDRAYQEEENGKEPESDNNPNDQIHPLSPPTDEEDAPDGVIIQAAEPLILNRRCCNRRSCCPCLFHYCPFWFTSCFCCCCEEEEEKDMVLPSKPSNEELLRKAFLSFLGFTICQCLVAIIAQSNAMIGDSLAMAVDCFTYGFNLYAERKKQSLHETIGMDEAETRISWERRIRKKKLQYEIIPPLVSVVCLFLITSVILRTAIQTITLAFADTLEFTDVRHYRRMEYIHVFPDFSDFQYSNVARNQQDLMDDVMNDTERNPNVILMMIFSTVNLFVDFYNVASFAKADRALGFNVEDRHHENQSNDATGNESGSDMATSLAGDDVKVSKSNKRKRNRGGARYSTLTARGEDDSDHDLDLENLDGLNKSGSNESFKDAQDHEWSYDDEEDLQVEGVDVSERIKALRIEEEDTEKEYADNPKVEDSHPQNGTNNVFTIDDMDDDPLDNNNVDSTVNKSTRDISSDEVDQIPHYDHSQKYQSCTTMEQANLNMCSAYTHIFVDTIRSMAVLIASLIAIFNEDITSEAADAAAAVAVSIAILIATIPLFIGLQKTGCQLVAIRREEIMEREHSQGIELGWKKENNIVTIIV